MAKRKTTAVIVLTRLKAGGKVWPQTMPDDDPAQIPDDVVEGLLEDGADEAGLIRLAQDSDIAMGVGGLTAIQQATVETSIRALPEGEDPTVQKINAALKAADAGFAINGEKLKAVQAALATPED